MSYAIELRVQGPGCMRSVAGSPTCTGTVSGAPDEKLGIGKLMRNWLPKSGGLGNGL